MDKKKLKHYLLEEEQKNLSEARKNLELYIEENKLDLDNVKDIDDLAQKDSNSFFEHDLETRIANHLSTIQQLEDINFEPSDAVRPGAVVDVNGKKLVIATPNTSFEFDGENYESISSSAPIYKEMQGKKVGESFHFNGKTFQIEAIY